MPVSVAKKLTLRDFAAVVLYLQNAHVAFLSPSLSFKLPAVAEDGPSACSVSKKCGVPPEVPKLRYQNDTARWPLDCERGVAKCGECDVQGTGGCSGPYATKVWGGKSK